jgi:hexosaminidase
MRALFAILFLVYFHCSEAQVIGLVPAPEGYLSNGQPVIAVKSISRIVYHYDFANEAQWLSKTMGIPAQAEKEYKASGNPLVIFMKKNESLANEAYNLNVAADKIEFLSASGAGMFYASQTFLQLLNSSEDGKIPVIRIKDKPAFNWRGMHLDCCRHFFTVEEVKRYIDFLALYKFNVFHWHLTEDQGWRIEIKKYPELTRKGAWRNGTMIGPYSDQKFDTLRYGGYYTQEQVRDIVAYAAARHITVVPEIEMPGHSLAALSAYPELSCNGGPFEVAKGWGVFEDVYCAGNEKVFEFLTDVLKEVLELFPSEYIHIGGDECPKTRWKECSRCQQRIKDNKLKDEHELQSYFIQRIEKWLNEQDRKIIGWDEILEGGLAPNAAVMSWRGTEGGVAAARQQHFAVMTPGKPCYFDHYQHKDTQNEPLAIGGYNPLNEVFAYVPIPSELNQEERKFILGAQGNVWTEYMKTFRHVEYMALPRMAALSEVLWNNKTNRDYEDFKKRLRVQIKQLDKLNVNYCKHFLNE